MNDIETQPLLHGAPSAHGEPPDGDEAEPLRTTLQSYDGHQIDVLSWLPRNGLRALLQIAHGMGEHAGRYARLARTLNEHGIGVYANHHRGHGARAAESGTLGDLGPLGFPALVSDMVQVTDHARTRHPQVPLLLLGHSMGSFATQLYMLDYHRLLVGVALSGTAATDLLFAARGVERRPEDSLRGIRDPRTPYDWLSRDEREVDRYVNDPLCGFTVNRVGLLSVFGACSRTVRPFAFSRVRGTLPVYLFTGDQDPVNHHLDWFHPLVQRMAEAGLERVHTKIYPGARHETLNETNREEVTTDLLAWIDKVLRNGAVP